VSVAIVVISILLAIGIVVESLVRLRKWLQKSPPGPQAQQPPNGDA
jgi:hypothetical protein